ncbi:SMP-30/gluconolactonase/LRE family protein [Microbacterium hominis]|uniref:SMP-30/gluconolactonase/LRE family protein n=1 Tax=Microbacterium hominis TaxID=162426 RepID=A0A7D4TQ58_9MICO|nr:SMP-30/gluconolactonase/LRE family protein [Microbacterium hominis]QKJ18904.1 SMP-30/gluconolactonase/LRE family protein [Microbacterium hominis]
MSSYAEVPSLGTPRVATGTSHFLAEGPTWDPIRGRILWVDIMAGVVYQGRFAHGGAIDIVEHVDFPDTAGAVAISAAGEWLVAGTRRLHTRSVDGTITSGPDLVEGEDRRFNDGKADPAGRFVAGTKGPGGELLLQIDAEGAATVLDDDLGLSNGLAWTRDGRTLYSIDTLARRIHVRDYDPATGATGERRVFLEITEGYPDGMTIDSDDHLWVALWGEGRVIRISPGGDVVGRVDVPAPNTSCPVFAGPDLDTLVITTATEGMSPEDLAAHPLSGRLFTVRTGHRGIHPNLWAGTPQPAPSLEETA